MRKKIFFLSLIALLFVAVGLRAQTLTHENYISRNFSYANVYAGWTPGTAPTADCEEDEYFYISRQRPLVRFTNANSQVNTALNPGRGLCWFCPISGDGWTSLPRYMFNSEAYNMWQYTDIHGNWTQGIHGCPGAMTDVAHKNGCAVVITSQPAFAANLSSDGNGAVYTQWINGGADKFLKHLAYYGYDGIGFNSECSFVGYTGLQGLWGQMHNKKAQYGKDLLCFPWYDGVLESGTGPSFSEQLNSGNDGWFWNTAANNYASKAHFINYNWDTQRGLATSQSTANQYATGASWHVYAGQDWQGATHDAQWTYLAEYNISIGVWGAHNKNMIYEGAFSAGSSGPVVQTAYLNSCERVFTGTTKNPVNTCALANNRAVPKDPWAGISKLVVARSALSWVTNDYFPFMTYFNLGNGESFKNEGVVTFDSEWYNIGLQDHLPTWRWWITNTWMGRQAAQVPENFKASLTYEDAWFGGSCLKVENTDAANTNVYLHLFKTQFPLATGYEFTIRYKVLSGSATLWLAGSKEGSEGTLAQRTLGKVSASDEWQYKSVTTSAWTAFNGGTLAVLGLRFQNPTADFKMLIGEMSVKKAGEVFSPVKPTINSTYSSIKRTSYLGIDFKLVWDCELGGGSGSVEPEPEEQETAVRAATLACTLSGNSSHGERYTSGLSFTGSKGASLSVTGLQSGTGQSLYYDKRTSTLNVQRGETITTTRSAGYGEWMLGYIYVDWNNDGDFADSGEYMAGHTSYPGGATCWNAPLFSIPDNVALGTYTMRYTADWNLTNDVDYGATHSCGRTATTVTDGGQNYTAANGGCMVDMELHVTAASGGSSSSAAANISPEGNHAIYNDEVDTWYFEIWSQQKDSLPVLITATTSWAGYAINAPYDVTVSGNEFRYGVRSVAPDGVTKSDIAWTEWESIPANEITELHDIICDKPVIKVNEDFTVSFKDPTHGAAASWVLKSAATDATVATFNGGTSFTHSLGTTGSYDLIVTLQDRTEINLPGFIQISIPEVGAVPKVFSIETTNEDREEGNSVYFDLLSTDVTAEYSYTGGRAADAVAGTSADGSVSQGVNLEETSPIAIDGKFIPYNKPITIAFWMKIRETQGDNTQFFALTTRNNSASCTGCWAFGNYGAMWSTMNNETGIMSVSWRKSTESGTTYNAGAVSTVSGKGAKVGSWVHLALTFEPGGYASSNARAGEFYFNGNASGSTTNTANGGTGAIVDKGQDGFKSHRLYIGGNANDGRAGLIATVDDIQIWHKKLSAAEVLDAMQGYSHRLDQIPNELVGYWSLDEYDEETMTFPNQGKGTWSDINDYVGSSSSAYGSRALQQGISFVNYGDNTDNAWSKNASETTTNGTYPNDIVLAAPLVAGNPALPGKFKVTTEPTWQFQGAIAQTQNDVAGGTSGTATATYDTEGSYIAKVTLANDWGSDSKTIEYVVIEGNHDGLQSATPIADMAVYPNPFVDAVNMKFAEAGKYTVEVIDMQGRLVSTASQEVEANNLFRVGINAEAGMYLLRVINANGEIVKTFKVEKK